MMAWALLLACNPFENNPPNLLTVNGYELGLFKNYLYTDELAFFEDFYAAPGTTWTVTLEVNDPEGQDVRIWWPNSPKGWEFDPDGTTGIWNVPLEGEQVGGIAVILEDTPRKDPELEAYIVPVMNALPEWGDSGVDSGL